MASHSDVSCRTVFPSCQSYVRSHLVRQPPDAAYQTEQLNVYSSSVTPLDITRPNELSEATEALAPQLARNLQQGGCTELNVPHDLTTTNSQLLEHSDSLILPEYSAASMAASYIMNDSVNTGLTSSYAIVNDPPEEVINAMNFDSQVSEMEIRDGQNVFAFAESIGNGMASTGLSNFPETKAPSATMMTGVSGPASSDISAGIDSGSLPPALQCLHPSCVSKSLFWRKCDLDKHVRLHSRKYFCNFPDCHMAQGRKGKGFGTKRDMLRHEGSQNPSKACPYCGKLLSRQDNLRVHCRRQHQS